LRHDVRIEKKFVRIYIQRTGKESSVNRRDFIKYLIDLAAELTGNIETPSPVDLTSNYLPSTKQLSRLPIPIDLAFRSYFANEL